jgi:hypothetical protein
MHFIWSFLLCSLYVVTLVHDSEAFYLLFFKNVSWANKVNTPPPLASSGPTAYLFWLFFSPFLWRYSPNRALVFPFLRFLNHTAGLLWSSDQPVAEASTYTGLHNIQTQETNIHAFSGIRTRDSSNQAVADLRIRPPGHRDQLTAVIWGNSRFYQRTAVVSCVWNKAVCSPAHVQPHNLTNTRSTAQHPPSLTPTGLAVTPYQQSVPAISEQIWYKWLYKPGLRGSWI